MCVGVFYVYYNVVVFLKYCRFVGRVWCIVWLFCVVIKCRDLLGLIEICKLLCYGLWVVKWIRLCCVLFGLFRNLRISVFVGKKLLCLCVGVFGLIRLLVLNSMLFELFCSLSYVM